MHRGTGSTPAARDGAAAVPERRPPHFSIPFPTELNPDTERAGRAGLRWARETGLTPGPVERRALAAPRYDRLAGHAYPRAEGPELDLTVQWMMWFFTFDDLFDGPFGRDLLAVGGLTETLIAAMYDGRGPHDGDMPLLRGFLDLCRRSVAHTSPSWRTRFHSDVEVYLRSYQWEAANRVLGRTPAIDTYLEMRRHSIGVWMSLDLAEPCGRFALPHSAFRSEAIQTMRRLCSDVVVLVNEVLSYDKDRGHGDVNLLVLLQETERLSFAEAVRRAQETVADDVRRYQDLEAGLDRLLTDLNLPPHHASDLERYAHAMRSWMRGNLDWSLETVRYRRRQSGRVS
ncbi:terpene synthase family protein [Streptomyces longispororuber]|uniref:terpene synthase family protein n=1 Tax=Streptomyces longispororuber TaxID=68230 RepID=UPI00210E1A7C|nr:hypothetical protein [Streptomyces longispororuber]MCQ4211276.1 hypothetical protein [Streptomyces longispororuber]